MARKILLAAITMSLVAAVVFALPALPDNAGINKAKDRSPAIDDNGNIQPPESELTKVVFIRYAPKFAGKACDNDGVCDADEKWQFCSDCKKPGDDTTTTTIPATACYGFLSDSKPKWNNPEDYYYADMGLGNLSYFSVHKWESATSGDIFGNGYPGNYPWGVYDYKNSISYGDYADEGVLGVTAIWFRAKTIYEYDIMLDTDFFPGNYDIQTVTLHEFGHAAGLDDLYDSECITEVMYGYLGEGQVKTVLQPGDIVGIQTLYGA